MHFGGDGETHTHLHRRCQIFIRHQFVFVNQFVVIAIAIIITNGIQIIAKAHKSNPIICRLYWRWWRWWYKRSHNNRPDHGCRPTNTSGSSSSGPRPVPEIQRDAFLASKVGLHHRHHDSPTRRR